MLQLGILLFFLSINDCSTYNIANIARVEGGTLIQDAIDNFFQNLNVSTQCQLDLLLVWNEVQNKEIWTLKMLDATGKMQSGIIEGNIFDLGSFDECIGINEDVASRKILGQYCMIEIHVNVTTGDIPRLSLFKGICLPHSCSIDDISIMFKNVNLNVTTTETLCQTQNYISEVGPTTWATLICFGLVFFLMVISTSYNIFVERRGTGQPIPILCAFSVLRNGRNIFTLNTSPEHIPCMYGLRAISMAWIIYGHVVLISGLLPLSNIRDLNKDIEDQKYNYIVGGTIAVDTFLFLGGITLSYTFIKSKSKKNNWLVFYVHRYLRLTPAFAATILVTVGLAKHLGSGPMWPAVSSTAVEPCTTDWWKAVLYINNFQQSWCIPQSWYLSVDMQLFLISPIILLPLVRKPRFGYSLIGILALCSAAISFALTWIYELGSNGRLEQMDRRINLMNIYYIKPYTRAGPWLVGILTGYLLPIIQQKQSKIKLDMVWVIILWTISLAFLAFSVFYQIDSFEYDDYKRLENSFYNAFVRTGWSIALSWVVIACQFGYGGIIAKILSLPVFHLLSKLTYTNYLLHHLPTMVYYWQVRSSQHGIHMKTFFDFWGIFMCTQFLSLIFTLAFESPVIAVEKWFFSRNKVEKSEK